MKKFIAIVIAAFAFTANAQSNDDFDTIGFSKFSMCLEASMIASQAYTLKERKIKLVYPQYDDLIIGVFMKQAIDYGYSAKSRRQATEGAHIRCLRSKLWADSIEE